MADCITSYKSCLEALYQEYIDALGVNPSLASSLQRKMLKVSVINASYWAADAAADESEKVIQCARLRSLFRGNVCIDDTGTGSSANIDSGYFEASDLNGSYVLSITHTLDTILIASAVVIDPDGVLETTLPVTVIDADTVEIDFGGSIASGQWTWIITAQPTI